MELRLLHPSDPFTCCSYPVRCVVGVVGWGGGGGGSRRSEVARCWESSSVSSLALEA